LGASDYYPTNEVRYAIVDEGQTMNSQRRREEQTEREALLTRFSEEIIKSLRTLCNDDKGMIRG
jgi:hypothetical protein